MKAIELKQLTFAYTDREEKEEILRNVNLDVEEGEFVCVLGRSGCGKSTFLKILAGLLQPGSGEVHIMGQVCREPGTDRALVFQKGGLFPWMTVEKNVIFGIRQARKALSEEEDRETAHRYLEKVGLAKAMHKYPYQLSGGMIQRTAIARAWAMDTPILLMDEPFGALDTYTRRDLQQELIELCKQSEKPKTIVFVTHDVNEAHLLAHRIITMHPERRGADAWEVTVNART